MNRYAYMLDIINYFKLKVMMHLLCLFFLERHTIKWTKKARG